MLERLTSAIAANRFGLGSRPGELDAIGGNARDWLRAQLKDAPPRLSDAQLRTSSDILVEALDLRREIRASRQAAATSADTTARGDPGSRTHESAAAAAPHLYRGGDRTIQAGCEHRSSLPRAAHAVLDEPLRGLRRQEPAARARRQPRARGDPPERARKLRRPVAGRRKPPGDAAVPRQPPLCRT